MIELIKNNIKPIAFILLFLLVMIFFSIKLSSLKNENENLKEKIELKTQKINNLSDELLKLTMILEEKQKQTDLENSLREKKQVFEAEINVCKDEFSDNLNNLIKEDDNVKEWCSQEIPSDIMSIFVN